MAQFYKVLKADPLGDPWTPKVEGGKPIQNFWCQVEGEEWDVSIGKQVPNVVTPGEQIYGNLMKAKSQRGTDYWKFKSEKVPDDVQRPASTPAQASAQAATGQPVDMSATQPDWFQPWGNMITYIYKQMKAMDTDPEPEPTPAPAPVAAEPAKPEQIAGEPISAEEQANLDGIFGGGEPEPQV